VKRRSTAKQGKFVSIYFDIETFVTFPNEAYALGYQVVGYDQNNEPESDSGV
jgi:hypothetical protein